MMPTREKSDFTVSVGFAPLLNQSSTFSVSTLMSAGSLSGS